MSESYTKLKYETKATVADKNGFEKVILPGQKVEYKADDIVEFKIQKVIVTFVD